MLGAMVEGKITEKQAMKIATRYFNGEGRKRRELFWSDTVGGKGWRVLVCAGNSNSYPDQGLKLLPRGRTSRSCWIVEMGNPDVVDTSTTYVAWVDRETGKVVRSGMEVWSGLADRRWFTDTTTKREKNYPMPQ